MSLALTSSSEVQILSSKLQL